MMSSNKRTKEMAVDRLSALPDSIIIHILSLLEVKQSAITATLSKRWRYLWTESPRLIFREKCGRLETVRKFVAWVNRSLVTCSRDSIDVFTVDFEYNLSFASDVDAWVQFAVKNKVKQVALVLDTWGSHFYMLPQLMYSNPYLKHLSIIGCAITAQSAVEWRSLTELYIADMEVQQHVIANILSGCPVLHIFSLSYCWGFDCLEITSQSVYQLGVCDADSKGGALLDISAPYIGSLCISLYPEGRKLRLTNIPANAKATIDFCEGPDNGGSDWDSRSVEVMNNAKELLGDIQHVKVVKLGYNYIEVLSMLALDGWRFPLSTSRTSLSVDVATEKCGIFCLFCLLGSSPNLETLVVEGNEIYWEPYNCPAAKDDLDCDLLRLTNVVIKNFVDPNLSGELMLTLARVLLKRAIVLEKMVIYVKESATYSSTLDTFKIVETLLSYPRTSRKASILLR